MTLTAGSARAQSGNPKGRPMGVRKGDGSRRAVARQRSRGADQEGGRARAGRRGIGAAALSRTHHSAAPRAAGPLGLFSVRGTADLAGTMAAITTAATQGTITPGQAAELARVVEIFVRAVETSDFERRLRELEEAYAARV